MRYDDLKTLIQPHVSAPVENLYAEFRTATGKEDVDNFLAYLQQRDLLSTQAFREIHASGGVDLAPPSPAPSGQTQGVMAETMMQQADPIPLVAATPPQQPVPPPAEERPNYAMMGLLGEGSMGKIYLAKDLSLRRKVAYKQLKPELARASPDIRERFINEAQITAQMDHPNVVPVYTIEPDDDGGFAYAMKLVQGKTFKDVITETKGFHDHGKPLDDDHALSTRIDYFLRVCDAISYAHSKGVIHRDLKPANIMVGRYNEVYVMDWGIARMVQSIMQPEATTMIELARKDGAMPVIEPTQAGQAVGTPRYMSPEQAAGANADLDERSDLYALGTILFELVFLKPAITGNSLKEAMVKVMKGNLEPHEHYNPRIRVPAELSAIIKKAVHLDRDSRYATVRELADDLRRFLRGDPVSVMPDTPSSKLSRWISRHRSATLVLLLGMLVVTALVLIGAMTRGSVNEMRANQARMLAATAAERAQAIDAQLLSVNGLLRSLSASAAAALASEPAEDAAPIMAAEFGKQTPDAKLRLAASPAYGNRKVSMAHPVAALAPSASEPAKAALRQLVSLRAAMQRGLLGTIDASADRFQIDDPPALARLSKEGSPVARLFVATESGAYLSYPGAATLVDGFDARAQRWYERAKQEAGVRWGSPKRDGQGQGVIITASLAVTDTSGKVIAVVGVDLRTQPLTALLGEGELIDRQGMILLKPGDGGSDKNRGPGRELDQPLPPLEAKGEAAQAARSSDATIRRTESQLVVSHPLSGLDASYVLTLKLP